ncbi:MAG: phosphoribosyl-AMP cyclohydrolase [candidate division WOR-3 bacterium]
MVIGSIDLMDGKVVQLRQGREKILEFDDALNFAKEFNKYNEVAVIDLDAAMGSGDNLSTIKELLRVADCRVGGGIRTIEKAKELIDYGANKIIIGSKAFEEKKINHEFLSALKQKLGKDKIVIALDTYNSKVVVSGWRDYTGIDLFDVIKEFEPYTNEFLFTFIESEGMMQGIDIAKAKKIREKTDRKIVVAGGVSSVSEVKILAEMSIDVQLGMALYTKRISLADAFIESLNWKNELIPTIAQDISGAVLMLAYSNKESLRKIFETGNMWYFSRSRQELWFKGKTSGNIQNLIKLRVDCDRDAILAVVRQNGNACHNGNFSCFNIRRPE